MRNDARVLLQDFVTAGYLYYCLGRVAFPSKTHEKCTVRTRDYPEQHFARQTKKEEIGPEIAAPNRLCSFLGGSPQ